MKGIAHFSVGVALASCFPDAVEAAASGNALHFLVGGVAGILPDTLDFRFARFLAHHDAFITPDPSRPDARVIAGGIAAAFQQASHSLRPVVLKVSAIRTGPETWQQYTIVMDVRARAVRVTLGPVVTTGGDVVATPRHGVRGTAESGLCCDVNLAYMASTTVDAFDGPSFELAPDSDGRVTARFITWHRQWSHSVIMAGLLGLGVGFFLGPLAGLIAASAVAAHAIVDQLGYLGGSLFYPLSRHRIPGLRLVRSGDAWGNFICVWFCGLLTFWNLARHAAVPCGPTLAQVVALGVVLPLAVRATTRLNPASLAQWPWSRNARASHRLRD